MKLSGSRELKCKKGSGSNKFKRWLSVSPSWQRHRLQSVPIAFKKLEDGYGRSDRNGILEGF